MLHDPYSRLVNPLKSYVRVFLWLTLIFLVLPLPLLFVPVEGSAVGLGYLLVVPLSLSMAIAAGISAIYSSRVSRRLRRFVDGEYLVHWTYTAEEWQKFAQSEFGQTSRAAPTAPKQGLFIGGLSGLVIGGAVGFGLYQDWPQVLLGILLGGVVLGGLGAAFGWLMRSLIRGRAGRTRRRVLNSIPEAYIAQDAAYCGGLYWNWTWRFPTSWLGGLHLLPGDPVVLEFTVCHKGEHGVIEHRFRVPIPLGREDEAQRVLQTLALGC